MMFPGFNYSEDLMYSVKEVGQNYFFNGRAGAFVEAYQESIERLAEESKQDKANAQEMFERVIEQGEQIGETGIKIFTLGSKIGRTSKRIAALTPLIAADGPLPIGDIVFVTLSVVEIGLLTYDVVTDVMDWWSDE